MNKHNERAELIDTMRTLEKTHMALSTGSDLEERTAEALRKAAVMLEAQPMKPLTEEQKLAMWHGAHGVHSSWGAYEWYAQGIEDSESAHGIKEQATTPDDHPLMHYKYPPPRAIDMEASE